MQGEAAPTLKDLLSRTPQGKAILAQITRAEQVNPPLLGAFLPGLMKPLKKIGKITSGFTTALAKGAAGMIGIPPSAIDALAHLDPTAHSALLNQLAAKGKTAPIQPVIAPKPKSKIFTPLNIGIGAGAGALLVFVVIMAKRKKKR